MVKTGPCLHCGIDFTPLWRNGPEDKPVLCNACGSRYRLCGNLENYFPKHFEPKHLNNLTNVKDGSNLKVRNKSSSYVSDSDGENPSLWNTMIPSKKRSRVVYKQMTPMKKFQKQLLNMWRYHRKSHESSPEEVLLSNNVNNFIPNNEIGLGVILLKPHGAST